MPGRFELSKVDLEEVSQVESGDNPPALIVFMKNSPGGTDTYVMEPLGTGFRHARKLKRRKKKHQRPKAPWC